MVSQQLREQLLEFRKARDWEQFHTPRNLAAAISVEAAELLEPFTWATESHPLNMDSARKEQIADEIADLAILLTYLSQDLSIDIEEAVSRKLEKNEGKYPIEKARGCNHKYSAL